MSIEEADGDVTGGSPQASGKDADNSDATHTNKSGGKEKRGAFESPPRSPDAKAKEFNREKVDDEKDVVVDMSSTSEVALRDDIPGASPVPPIEEEDYKIFHRRMLSRLLAVLLAQWLVATFGGIAGAAINGPISYRNPTYIVLTLLFVAIFIGHLAYLSLSSVDSSAHLGSASGGEQRAACALQLRVANLAKLVSLTLTLCGLFYALTGCFSQICFNLIAVSVLLSLGVAFFLVAVLPGRPLRMLEFLNGALVATALALVLVGSPFCNSFGFDAYATHPIALTVSTIVGVALAAWLILGALRALDAESDTKVVQLDFGASSILNIYAGGINAVWKLVVDAELLQVP